MRTLVSLCGVAVWMMLACAIPAFTTGGCASHPEMAADHATTKSAPIATAAADTAMAPAILYHRTGGFAGTDDRVVIWPDGLVQVRGRVLSSSEGHLSPSALARLHAMFDGWDQLKDDYSDATVADAYTITISRGGKTIRASDLAPDLPERFKQIYTEIEAIAAQAAARGPAPAP